MPYFKGGYFIDEIDKKLAKQAGKDALERYYVNNLSFSVEELSTQVDLSEVNPLLKVVWNIVTRGRPTRASLNLSKYILQTHLGDDRVSINFDGPEATIEYYWPKLDEVDTGQLKNLLENFTNYSEEQVAKRLGEQCLILFRILTELQAASKVHQLILLLYIIYNPSGQFDVEIKGIDQNLAKFIVQDLNELVANLNSLISDIEKPINEISFSETKKSLVILVNDTSDTGFSIRSLSPEKIKESEESDYFQRVLTDRRIVYKQLGTLHEEEVDDRYVQNFEYSSDKQQKALQYILQNLFRKSEFRSGQESIINRALIDKDVIGLLPTGGGKSLTYQICGLLQPGVSIIIEPINSLMKDQYDGLISNGISNAVFINSFNTMEEREENLSNLVGSRYQFVYISPERLQIQKFRSHLTECANYGVYFSFAVIDEAHCVSEWGHDFRHTYLNLAHNLKRFCKAKEKELIFFGLTATASFDVLADVQRELEMAEDAIVTLPADAIDRKELNFNIIRIEKDLGDEIITHYYYREEEVAEEKYPTLKKSIERIPEELKRLSGKTQIVDLGNNFFDTNEDGEYENAGIIFCPTKSDKLKNGVLSVKDYLDDRISYLDIGTFFGGGDEDSIRNSRVEQEASDSVDNQDAFMNNEMNLMIATKAFGMGLDKPNIRYTYHYSFPDSVESFYQEAGRAGRDGKNSLCNILYYDEDIRTNYDFYQNSFKGISREKEIINEFLTEVQYEDGFYAEIINRKARDEFPEINKVSYWNDRYLNIFGAYHKNPNNRVQIASIDLKRDLRTYDNFIKNFDQKRSKVIADRVIEILKTEAGDQDYIEWLNTTSSPGIKTLLDQDDKKNHTLLIGFNNNVVNELSEFLQQSNPGFEPRVVRAAYNFCRSADEFIDNLHFRYRQHSNYTRYLIIDDGAIDEIKSKYYQIRNTGDTLRAIYRFMISGIVDDYVIDYAARMVKIEFQAKTYDAYFKNLNQYLKRYLGNESTQKWMKIARGKEYESVLKKVLFTLIEFIEQEISERKRAIDYMQQLCEIGYEQGDQVFRENIIYYFTSKYARVNYLPKDTDGGRVENADIVKKYLGYISNPPDGLGGEINNAKHLRGACENLRITMTRDNASIDLLTSYSYFALESQQSDNFEMAMERPLIQQAIKLYKKGFRDLQEKESWISIQELLEIFNNQVLDINPMIEPVLEPLINEFLIYRTYNRLNKFLKKIS